jgi:pilus assembly protein CpaE
MVKFLLATCDTVWPARVRDVFGNALNGDVRIASPACLDHPVALLSELRDSDSPVLVLGPGIGFQAALVLAQAVDEHRQDVSVILVAEPSPVLLQEAVRVGVRDVVDPKASEDIVRGSLALAFDTAVRRRAGLHSSLEAHGRPGIRIFDTTRGASPFRLLKGSR